MKRYSDVFRIGPRGSGRTAVVAEACKKIGATMICDSTAHAAQVMKQYGINTASKGAHFQGMRGPYLADHFAIEQICYDYESQIDRMAAEIGQLQEERDDAINALRDTYSNIENLDAATFKRVHQFETTKNRPLDYLHNCPRCRARFPTWQEKHDHYMQCDYD